MSKKRALSRFLGFEQVKASFSNTKSLLEKSKPNISDINEESFSEACIRFGIQGNSEEVNNVLSEKYNQIKFSFYVKLTFGLLALLVMFLNIIYYNNFISAFISFLLFFSIIVFSASNSFRCYQINERSLGLLKQWISSPKNWFPRKFKKSDWIPESSNNNL